jgi:hypothetical protein
MKTQKSLLLSATMAAATAAAATLATLPAQAMGLNGSLSITGDAIFGNPNELSPATTTLGFENVKVNTKTGDFMSGNFESPRPDIKTLNLTKSTGAFYNFNSTSGFINFGSQNLDGNGLKDLTFNLDAGQLIRMASGGNVNEFSFPGVTGIFNYGGSTVGTGFLSATKTGASSTFQITLTAKSEPVPEPLTILGTGVALGFGAMFKNRATRATANRNK